MRLEDLLRDSGVAAELRGDSGVEISGLAYDSRRVAPGTLFFCVTGLSSDGHEFAGQAVEAGAAALVVERPLDLGVPEVQVAEARAAMAPLAAMFWGDPTEDLTVIGVTGTNGKTTTAFLVRHLLEDAGRRCGLLGTVQRVVGGEVEEVERTTPEAIDLQATFRRMADAGDEACVLEVSSHALVLHRADAIHFDVKVFTNLTQDHLDFHEGMEDYFAAKRLLFTAEGGAPTLEIEGGVSAVNVDDPYGRRLAEELAEGPSGDRVTYSPAGGEADLSAREAAFDAAGSNFTCVSPAGALEVRTPLPGDFNVANALAALAVAHALGLDLRRAAAALASAGQVPGRFESIDEGQPFAVIVDYAHTPDSLQNVLDAARRITEGRVISAFGCGGDRDREKRPLMGRAGSERSDLAIVTSDNPRSEEPAAIIDEIVSGIDPGLISEGRVVVETDRRAAIARALEAAEPGDTVVIAGKGHEQGQEFEGGRKIPFDDRDVARDELRKLAATTR
jgi:UDP-N-acetylmuramoyl-L-alanyl-D-glutamate--2,6-diaminopimelate ligase